MDSHYLYNPSRYLALLVAWVATCGSLFFSEVLHWVPCSLCWYQRILMYPLSVVLAIGLWRRDRKVHTYAIPFALIGAGVSLYHYLIQKSDWLAPPVCSIGVPCSVDYLNWLGFITIPLLALTAFLLINLLMIISAIFTAETLTAEDEHTAMPRARFGAGQVAVVAIVVGVMLAFVVGAQLV
jgi:disulfide bond formation protein DsbB